MPFITINTGALLILIGFLGYFAPSVFSEKNTPYAMTSLIPAGIGLVLEIAGILSLSKPNLRKHAMHLAALAGILGFLGGFMPLFRSQFDFSKASSISGLLMSLICLIFVVLCVRSFIQARKARTASSQTQV